MFATLSVRSPENSTQRSLGNLSNVFWIKFRTNLEPFDKSKIATIRNLVKEMNCPASSSSHVTHKSN